MTEQQRLAQLLFENIDKTPADYEAQYPPRALPEDAVVTRFAPSPTGFLHMGGLFAAFVARRAAKATNGLFFLRIEDTDKKRQVEDGISQIVKGLSDFGIIFDEGMTGEDTSKGDYGPYIQSQRKDIYQAFAKDLVERGLAYPCFCSSEQLDAARQKQEQLKQNPGYYGEYALCRELTYEEVEKRIQNGESYVLRLKSPGTPEGKAVFEDAIKGRIEMPENTQDVVLLKADGIPTYHFAHAVDDHLMRTTDVIRGDEWISSVPVHLQLFEVLGFKPPRYAHISPIMKEDQETGGKRKLSKRKDPEASVTYYHEMGYPKEAVLEYLLTIANSNYEQWREENPKACNTEFPFALAKMSKAGALFDLVKLTDISKNYISLLDAKQVYEDAAAWAKVYEPELYALLERDPAYAKAIFAIERNPEKPRKDITKWQDVKGYVAYFYEELWDRERDFPENLSAQDMIHILEAYQAVYDPQDTGDEWFPKIREMSEALGYAKAPKFYKKDPESFKGHVGDVSAVIRVAATGRRNTPDLYEILQVLGKERVLGRFAESIELLKK
jgi:glutamyl-tRNA synthetase